jgi:hypothetical protein
MVNSGLFNYSISLKIGVFGTNQIKYKKISNRPLANKDQTREIEYV